MSKSAAKSLFRLSDVALSKILSVSVYTYKEYGSLRAKPVRLFLLSAL